jgi:uncharacterized membrane protein
VDDAPTTGDLGEGEASLEDWIAYAPDPEPEKKSFNPDGLAWIVIGLGVLTVLGMIALRPTGESKQQAELTAIGLPTDFYGATVVSVTSEPCLGFEEETCIDVDFEITEGPDTGDIYTQNFPPGSFTPAFRIGTKVVLSRLAPTAVVESRTTQTCDFDPEAECEFLNLFIEDDGDGIRAAWEVFPGGPASILYQGDPAVVDYIIETDGSIVLLGVSVASTDAMYGYADYERSNVLFWLFVIFAASVIALGGIRGVAALGGLAASVAILLAFVLPAILDGRSPLLVAIVGASAIAFLALYLSHGFTRMTTVALLGTLGALALTAVLSAVVTGVAEFSGFASEESTLLTLFEGIDVRGLLLAGIVLGAAGAIDDVTVTQASAVWELKRARPASSERELFRGGLKIGRDHIASTVNTLLLAYAGAALPLLVLFILAQQSLGTIANGEVVAIEIVRTLVGSIGLVAAVPFTTWLAARTAGAEATDGES